MYRRVIKQDDVYTKVRFRCPDQAAEFHAALHEAEIDHIIVDLGEHAGFIVFCEAQELQERLAEFGVIAWPERDLAGE